jgi:hypothetical protein
MTTRNDINSRLWNIANVDANGNITGLTLTANINSGNASLGNTVTANYFTGTLTTGAQPNITSTGTLTSASVTGNISGGNVNTTGIVTATNNIVVNSANGQSEGGQLVLAWTAVNGLVGQANSTWSMDVDGSNNYRVFYQNATGGTGVPITAYSANADVSFGANVAVAGGIKMTPVTVSNLPNANVGAGSRAFVSDANTTTFAAVVGGSGSNNVPVYSDGTDWRVG